MDHRLKLNLPHAFSNTSRERLEAEKERINKANLLLDKFSSGSELTSSEFREILDGINSHLIHLSKLEKSKISSYDEIEIRKFRVETMKVISSLALIYKQKGKNRNWL